MKQNIINSIIGIVMAFLICLVIFQQVQIMGLHYQTIDNRDLILKMYKMIMQFNYPISSLTLPVPQQETFI